MFSPTLNFLQQFDAALVWGFLSTSYDVRVNIGDVLAQYRDLGGSVVLAVDMLCNGKLTGKFADYNLMDGSAKTDSSVDSLGVTYEQDSPLLSGVNTLSANPAPKCTGTSMNGGISVAAWKSGVPLIVRGVKMGRPLVVLNMYPVSASISDSGWTGDGANILRNAVLYSVCAPCGAKYSSAGEPSRRINIPS